MKYVMLALLVSFNVSAVERLVFDNWEIDYNCEMRGYEYFHYTTVKDQGELPRYKPFHQEHKLPKECRQLTTGTYKQPIGVQNYDRGHGVHSNIWDHNNTLMKQSNSFANIVPQAKKLNRSGVWRQTEILTECYRDEGEVEVWGGVIWGDNAENDKFIYSHGVVTPDYLWKVIKFPDGNAQAWLMPNDDSPTKALMDNYLVKPSTITKYTGYSFRTISLAELNEKDTHSFKKPKYCSIK